MDKVELRILSRQMIKPSSSTPESLRSYKLSLFDRLAPPTYIRMILFYSAQNGDQGTRAQKAERLKRSLSESLTKFYPLAGRIVGPDNAFICGDQGVEYLEAEVDGDLVEFLDERLQKVEILDGFLPKDVAEADLATRPLATFQISLFRCGGLAIGLSFSHKIADTSTVVGFINGWATTSRVGIHSLVCPSFDTGSVFPVTESSTLKLLKSMIPKIATRRFVFKGTKISDFITKFMESFSGNNSSQPSRVTVVSAVIWKALINIARAKHGHSRPSLLAPAMGLRGKTDFPISERCFGNLWFPVIAHYEANKRTCELEDVVSVLDNAMKRTAESIKSASKDGISLMATNAFGRIQDQMLQNMEVDVFICTSWCRIPINKADFGWGQPCRVSGLSRPCEMFTLMDSKDGDCIDALVCLNENDMPQFGHDPDILTFTC